MKIKSFKMTDELQNVKIADKEQFELDFIRLSRRFIKEKNEIRLKKIQDIKNDYGLDKIFELALLDIQNIKCFDFENNDCLSKVSNDFTFVLSDSLTKKQQVLNDLVLSKYYYFLKEYMLNYNAIISLFKKYLDNSNEEKDLKIIEVNKNFKFVLSHLSNEEIKFLEFLSQNDEFQTILFKSHSNIKS